MPWSLCVAAAMGKCLPLWLLYRRTDRWHYGHRLHGMVFDQYSGIDARDLDNKLPLIIGRHSHPPPNQPFHNVSIDLPNNHPKGHTIPCILHTCTESYYHWETLNTKCHLQFYLLFVFYIIRRRMGDANIKFCFKTLSNVTVFSWSNINNVDEVEDYVCFTSAQHTNTHIQYAIHRCDMMSCCHVAAVVNYIRIYHLHLLTVPTFAGIVHTELANCLGLGTSRTMWFECVCTYGDHHPPSYARLNRIWVHHLILRYLCVWFYSRLGHRSDCAWWRENAQAMPCQIPFFVR